MVNVKKKGNKGEQAFAAWLRSKGIKAWKDAASGGGSGSRSDINTDTEFGFEVKTVKRINLQEAWKQCDTAAGMNKTVPVLAIHFDGMGKDEWLTVMHSEDWIEYVTGREETEQNYQDPKAKYALQNLKDACTQAMKYL